MKHQMSIQSIKIKIGNETKELTIKEAKALKDALDELFPSKLRTDPTWFSKTITPIQPTWVPPTPYTDPFKPYCTVSHANAGTVDYNSDSIAGNAAP